MGYQKIMTIHLVLIALNQRLGYVAAFLIQIRFSKPGHPIVIQEAFDASCDDMKKTLRCNDAFNPINGIAHGVA